MLDIRSFTWDEEAIAISGVNPNQLPDLVRPEEIVGGLSRESASITGLQEGLPIIAGTSDGGLANLGSGAVAPGQRVVTVGTSGAVRRIVDQPWVDPQGRTWCYALMKDVGLSAERSIMAGLLCSGCAKILPGPAR